MPKMILYLLDTLAGKNLLVSYKLQSNLHVGKIHLFLIIFPEYNNGSDKFWRRLYAQLPQAPSTMCEKMPFYSLIFQNSSSRKRSRKYVYMNNVTIFTSNNDA